MNDDYAFRLKAHTITKTVLDKSIELLNNDNDIPGFSKSMMVGGIIKFQPKILEYILKMDEKKAEDMINEIKKVIG